MGRIDRHNIQNCPLAPSSVRPRVRCRFLPHEKVHPSKGLIVEKEPYLDEQTTS